MPTPDPNDSTNAAENQAAYIGIIRSFIDAPNGFSEEISEIIFSAGIEYWYKGRSASLGLRTGYYYEHWTKGNSQLFTTGLGLKFDTVRFDLSYSIPTNTQRYLTYNPWIISLLLDLETRKINHI